MLEFAENLEGVSTSPPNPIAAIFIIFSDGNNMIQNQCYIIIQMHGTYIQKSFHDGLFR